MTEREEHDLLVAGLVGDRVELFQRNATFHAAIETLAKLIPATIDEMAIKAENAQRIMDATFEAMTSWTPDPATVDLIRRLGEEETR